jgi:carboxypeptidase C (cathepsin A)
MVRSKTWRCGAAMLAFQAALGLGEIARAADSPSAPVVSSHAIRLGKGEARLAYAAEAGRLPIHDPATGRVTGQMFYVAYRVAGVGKPRPLAFIWNGGPGANSTLLHFEAFGPKRLAGGRLQDNPQTLLKTADLVFVDPVGTGFSRPATPDDAGGFYSTLGDTTATAAFVQGWRAAHGASKAPVFLIGESYGVWRAAATAETLAKAGQAPAGVVLISGGSSLGPVLSPALSTALKVPSMTAAALFHHRLSPDLSADPDQTLAQAEHWALSTYAPALRALDVQTPTQRDALAAQLAGYIGLDASAIDRKSLKISPRAYLKTLVADRGLVLDTFDMRKSKGDDANGAAAMIAYLRQDLGYKTDLPYLDLEKADPPEKNPGELWDWNSGVVDAAAMAAAMAGEGPPGAEPWLARAIAVDPKLKALVAAGVYDSLNSCAANRQIAKRLEPALASKVTFNCYTGGHMMYRDEQARLSLLRDVSAFMAAAKP